MNDAHVVRAGGGTLGTDCTFLVTAAESGGRFDFMIAEVGYHSGPPLHAHREQDDTFYVLEGTLACQVNDTVSYLGPGDLVCVPPGVPHTFDNLDPDQGPVRAVNLMTPGGFLPFMNELERELARGELSPDALHHMEVEHGVTWLGPTMHDHLDETPGA